MRAHAQVADVETFGNADHDAVAGRRFHRERAPDVIGHRGPARRPLSLRAHNCTGLGLESFRALLTPVGAGSILAPSTHINRVDPGHPSRDLVARSSTRTTAAL